MYKRQALDCLQCRQHGNQDLLIIAGKPVPERKKCSLDDVLADCLLAAFLTVFNMLVATPDVYKRQVDNLLFPSVLN